MKKEVFIAIATGLILGLVISLAIYQARQMYTADANSEATIEVLPPATPTPELGHQLEIIEPSNFTLAETDTLTISGNTTPDSYVTMVSDTFEGFVQAGPGGEFNLDFPLETGVNIITITSIDQEGYQASGDITITYLIDETTQEESEDE